MFRMKGLMINSLFLLLLIVLALPACSPDNSDTTGSPDREDRDDNNDEDGDTEPVAATTTIYDIQNPDSPNHPIEGHVALTDILVTSDPFQVSSSGLMGIFVAEQAGGEWSGCMLTWKPTSADSEFGYDPPSMQAGMIVDIEGKYTEFCGIEEPYYDVCSTQIELTPFQADNGRVVDTGKTAELPEPKLVDAAAVTTGGELSEPWQNALIKVENVTVSDVNENYGEFSLSAGLSVDDMMFEMTLPSVGAEFEAITGFLYTAWGDFKLAPRSEADLSGGEGSDGDIDPEAVSVFDIQNPNSPNHPNEGPVKIEGVIVTSVPFEVASSGLMGVLVSDEGGGEWTGVMITWLPSSTGRDKVYDPPALTPGMIIDVEGNYEEFCGTGETPDAYCSTQITLTPFNSPIGEITDTGETAQVPEPQVVLPEEIKTGGTQAEKWQHSLVKVLNVEVTTPDAGYGQFEVADGLLIDDILYHYDLPQPGQMFSSLTGFLYTSFNEFKLLPRSPSDMVTDGEIDGDDDPIDGDEDTMPVTGLAFADLQNPQSEHHPSVGQWVNVENLVVTSIPFEVASTGLWGVFVSDQGGGQFSGGLVTWYPSSTERDLVYDPPALNVGMVIDVYGKFNEFCGAGEEPNEYCSTQVELTPHQETQTGEISDTGETATPPAAQTVDPAVVCTGCPDAEAWQFSLLQVENVEVTNPDAGYGQFVVTGNLMIDDVFYRYDLPTIGAEFSMLRGFLYTSYNEYKLLPRYESDMVSGDVVEDGDEEDEIEDDELEDEPIVDGDEDISEDDTTEEAPIEDGDTDETPVTGDVMINELLYDGEGGDSTSVFIELYGEAGASLDGYTLVGVNGNDSEEYKPISLDGQSIPPDGYFVITHPDATGDAAANTDFSDTNADYQNGDDSIVLKRGDTAVDMLGYGDTPNETFFTFETAPAADVSAGNSLARIPDHNDTDDNSADFTECATPTPGAENLCEAAE